jgi:copper oxidase (laccase) domain-containing protein
MTTEFGTCQKDLVIAIGPAIGGCCFEVGDEVASQFGKSGRVKIDLVETTLRQLGRNDGAVGRFATSGLCTLCGNSDLLHSYRRDREAAGRMVAAIQIRVEVPQKS